MELTQLYLHQAAELIRRRELSPVELTRAYLRRIEQLNPRLNCFITLTAEMAEASARSAEADLQRGEYRGALHGIPIALKDLFETQGVLTSGGSTFFADYIPQRDAYVVQRLKAAGAVMLGKLNMHEIALGVTNNNPHYGACHNPWALERISGGSSGGCGAALAAQLCLGALGSDTGGSTRIPASLCGVVGLKPTFGRISLRGVMPLSWNLDHVGPMARCVRDVALLFQSIAGYDAEDPYSAPVQSEDYLARLEAGVRGWRVALAVDDFFTQADEQVCRAVKTAAEVFTSLGAQVDEVHLPEGLEAARANGLMVVSDAAAVYRQPLQSNPEGFGKDVLQRLQSGAAYSAVEYALARHQQALWRHRLERLFEGVDVLLTPTTPIVAPFIEGPDAVEQARILTRFTSPFNLAGLPALSVPCGFSQEGLPIGLQLVARPWAEAKVLQAGFAYEQATEWHRRRPQW
jgi:aspartyl-tRNA(Asn)/glutamyl-tRNA(Gln) amidotransferase subunit A